MDEKYKLYLGDSRTVCDDLSDVQMIMTSPPYFSFRKNYSGNNDSLVGNVSADEYADWFLTFTEKFLKCLKTNGSFFLNINEKIEKGEVHPVIDELKYKMRKQGWKLVAKPYIWFKPGVIPHNCRYRTIDRYEYVFHFSNSVTPDFYAGNCRVPYAASSIKRYKDPISTFESRDGIYSRRKKEPHPDGSLPHNIVEVNHETNPSIIHPAPFSVELAEWFVKIGSKEGDIVLDPFMGAGSTGVAAVKNNRKFIGIDIVNFNLDFSGKRIDNLIKTGETYIPKNKLVNFGIDPNHYKIKGEHLNFM